MKPVALVLLLLAFSAAAQDRVTIKVPPGDVGALNQALQDAYGHPDRTTILRLSGIYRLPPELEFPRIRSRVVIKAHSAPVAFEPVDEGPEQLFLVDPDGDLTLNRLEIRDFSLRKRLDGLIENYGELRIEGLQFTRVGYFAQCSRPTVNCNGLVMPILFNANDGRLTLDQVSFKRSGFDATGPTSRGAILTNLGHAEIRRTQVFMESRYSPPVRNEGSLNMNFSTFRALNSMPLFSSHQLPVAGSAEMRNSIVAGFTSDSCNAVSSRGYNFVDAAGCAFDREGDRTGVPLGILWRPANPDYILPAYIGLFTHALLPVPASPVVDAVPEERCSNGDLVNENLLRRKIDGNGDGIARCDAGAVELRPTFVDQGGINGLFWVPEADGHYLYILDNDYNTLVTWTTFDADGNPAWVYGIGELVAERSVIADVYVNREGRVSLDGELEPAEADRWGTLTVELFDCDSGLVAFDSDQPGFGSGQFEIARLAYVKQLGCVD